MTPTKKDEIINNPDEGFTGSVDLVEGVWGRVLKELGKQWLQ